MTDTKPKRWLVIPLEVQVRELVARLLVAAIAADRGYDVLIGHDRVVRRLARHLPKGILFDKALGMSTVWPPPLPESGETQSDTDASSGS